MIRLVSVGSVPSTRIPPPSLLLPFCSVNPLKTALVSPFVIVTTLPLPPPSIMVASRSTPTSFRFLPSKSTFSTYVPAATLILSPSAANRMAGPILAKALKEEPVPVILLPLVESTYHTGPTKVFK